MRMIKYEEESNKWKKWLRKWRRMQGHQCLSSGYPVYWSLPRVPSTKNYLLLMLSLIDFSSSLITWALRLLISAEHRLGCAIECFPHWINTFGLCFPWTSKLETGRWLPSSQCGLSASLLGRESHTPVSPWWAEEVSLLHSCSLQNLREMNKLQNGATSGLNLFSFPIVWFGGLLSVFLFKFP